MALTRQTILSIPKSNIHRFGAWNNIPPTFRDLQWSIQPNEAWAIVSAGSAGKTALFQTLLGHLRISPSSKSETRSQYGLYPFLHPHDPYQRLSYVSFNHRSQASSGGAFVDFTARYGALRDEDKITLRQSMFPETIPEDFLIKEKVYHAASQQQRDEYINEEEIVKKEERNRRFEVLVDQLELRRLLDVPKIALSNGQTRRARILKAILSNPALLLLDEPLTGLDVHSRPILVDLLQSLHVVNAPHIVMGLRTQDSIPDWITHLAFVHEDSVLTGKKDAIQDIIDTRARDSGRQPTSSAANSTSHQDVQAAANPSYPAIPPEALLADLQNATIKYSDRVVLNNITWQIRAGEKWHLKGSNGSGKTTLLSILTGTHPLSFSIPHLKLLYPNRPRKQIPTPHLAAQVSLFSPELFDAFPRRHHHRPRRPSQHNNKDKWAFIDEPVGGRVWDIVGTGFDGVFVESGKYGDGKGVQGELSDEERAWRVRRVKEVLEALGPETVQDGPSPPNEGTVLAAQRTNASFGQEQFVSLSTAEQRIVLLMRAIVGRAPIVILDEVWSGMEEGMVRAVTQYFRRPATADIAVDSGAGGAFADHQAVIVVTHWEDEVPWGLEEGLKVFRLKEGGVGTVE
ncbi:P-loop containing nucleoside triphosphate hydrolase protein [Pluteus cervinus]|uniref:P-loop containing nucleoside triphosphate hydrolase protein n=1 Tax=Pluteus cervinus TaxID=181527 RepID=A0ACD3B0E3_9AGAR|nr:P-loop containing nucleoside triphosphate hydrolase protein [Pluteus cervinus]